ncbi:MAG TPA: secretin N-terminal domain-containing protein, partial [Gemmata sp.]
ARGLVSRRVLDTTEGVVRSMFATKLQQVGAAALCCGLALACATGGIHFANAQPEPKPVPLLMDEPKPPHDPRALLGLPKESPRPEPAAPKSATVIPLRKLDPAEAARALAKSFEPKRATIAPLADEKALLVFADATVTNEIGAALVALGEPAPKYATVLRLIEGTDPAEVVTQLRKLFAKDSITCVAVPDEPVMLLFASKADTALARRMLRGVLETEPTTGSDPVLKTVTLKFRPPEEVAAALRKLFGESVSVLPLPQQKQLAILARADQLDSILKAVAELDQLRHGTPPRLDKENEAVLKTMTLKHRTAEEVAEVLQKLIGERVRVVALKQTNQVMVLGLPSAIELATKLVEEQDKPLAPTPPAKTFTLKFQDAEWADVLDWYAKASGLTLITAVRPTGQVTIASGNRALTLGEVTDLINDALLPKKHLLIRRGGAFTVVAADEKIDPALVPRIAPKDLEQRGRTELVQVIIPVPQGAVAGLVPEVKKMLGPLGSVVALRQPSAVLVQDAAANVIKIRETIARATEPEPKGPRRP